MRRRAVSQRMLGLAMGLSALCACGDAKAPPQTKARQTEVRPAPPHAAEASVPHRKPPVPSPPKVTWTEPWLDLSHYQFHDDELEWKLDGATVHHGDKLTLGTHRLTAYWHRKPDEIAGTATLEVNATDRFEPELQWTPREGMFVCGTLAEWEILYPVQRRVASVVVERARTKSGLWSEDGEWSAVPSTNSRSPRADYADELEVTGLVILGGHTGGDSERLCTVQTVLHESLGSDGWFRLSGDRVSPRCQAILVTALWCWPGVVVKIIEGGSPSNMAMRASRALFDDPSAGFPPDLDAETAAWIAVACAAAWRCEPERIGPLPTVARARTWTEEQLAALLASEDPVPRQVAMLTVATRLLLPETQAGSGDRDAERFLQDRTVVGSDGTFDPLHALFAALALSKSNVPEAETWRAATAQSLLSIQTSSRTLDRCGGWAAQVTKDDVRLGRIATTALSFGALTLAGGGREFRMLGLWKAPRWSR